jgi:hypothetical protein
MTALVRPPQAAAMTPGLHLMLKIVTRHAAARLTAMFFPPPASRE